jgi:hypothetical protein
VVVFTVAFVVAMAFALVAHAQTGVTPPGPAPAPVPPTNAELAGYCAAGVAFLNMLASMMRDDNNVIKWAPPVVTRILVVAAGGVGQAFLLALAAGTPWPKAIVGAIASATIAWGASGTRAPGSTGGSKRPPGPAPEVNIPPPPAVPPPASPSLPGVST